MALQLSLCRRLSMRQTANPKPDPCATYFSYPRCRMSLLKQSAVCSNPKAGCEGASLKPNPGILGTTTWKPSGMLEPGGVAAKYGSDRPSMTLLASRKLPGQPWQINSGIAFAV